MRRDLKVAMESYFSQVVVVDSAKALPSTPHVVGDVKVEDIKLESLVPAMLKKWTEGGGIELRSPR